MVHQEALPEDVPVGSRGGGQRDARLIRRALNGDPLAQGALDARLALLPGLVRACHARMGSPLLPEDLDDAIQETSLTAWSRRTAFRGDSTLETWIYGIARLCILQQLGARRRTSHVENDMSAAEARPETGAGPATQADTGIQRAIRTSLRRQGHTVEVIVSRKSVAGDSFVEIAADLDMEPATVKTRYYRSLPKLRSMLDSLWREIGA